MGERKEEMEKQIGRGFRRDVKKANLVSLFFLTTALSSAKYTSAPSSVNFATEASLFKVCVI